MRKNVILSNVKFSICLFIFFVALVTVRVKADGALPSMGSANFTDGENTVVLPCLSHEQATLFIAFVYNQSDYQHIDLSGMPIYQLLTGDYSAFENKDMLVSEIWALSTFVRTSMNTQVKGSGHMVNYLSVELCDYLASELEGLKNEDELILKEVKDKIQGYLKQDLLDIMTSTLNNN